MTDHKGELRVQQSLILACLFLVQMSGRPGLGKDLSGPQDSQPPSAQKQQTTGAPQGKESPKPDEHHSQSPPQRIVDPKDFPPKKPLPVRIIQAPFHSLAARTNRMLTRLEETKMLERVRIILSNPTIHPLIGNLGDGSGFGLGVYASTADRLSKRASFFATSHLTTKTYFEATAGFLTTPAPQSLRGFELQLATRYRLRPEEDFFGIGPQSHRDQRSSYDLQERGVDLTASYRLRERVRLGIELDYSSTRVFRGKDPRFPTTQAVFGPQNLPGLAKGAALLSSSIFAELDARDVPGNPHAGAYLRAQATSTDSVSRGDFGFVNFLVDARGYVPLGTKRRVLALRLLGNFNDPKGGSDIPFFRLARLGDSHTLRGYDSFRFHGRNALVSSIEYRYDLVQGISAVAFTDFGQVFNRRSEFNRDNLHATWGGGIQIGSKKSIALRILYGRSGEGARIFFSFGPTF